MRDCKTCAYDTRDGCSTWDCEYINRNEAIEAWKREQIRMRGLRDEKGNNISK